MLGKHRHLKETSLLPICPCALCTTSSLPSHNSAFQNEDHYELLTFKKSLQNNTSPSEEEFNTADQKFPTTIPINTRNRTKTDKRKKESDEKKSIRYRTDWNDSTVLNDNKQNSKTPQTVNKKTACRIKGRAKELLEPDRCIKVPDLNGNKAKSGKRSTTRHQSMKSQYKATMQRSSPTLPSSQKQNHNNQILIKDDNKEDIINDLCDEMFEAEFHWH